MRTWILWLAVGCAAPTPPITEKTTVPTNMQEGTTVPTKTADGWTSGPGGFPIPPDAGEGQSPGRKIDVSYPIARKRDDVYAQVVNHIKGKGYVIDSEQMFAGGHRMEVHNDKGRKFTVSITALEKEDDPSTLMTVTAGE
jgi:hypothetical protein